MSDTKLATELASHAEATDRALDWPAASWDALVRHGVLKRSIPRRFGGDEWPYVEQLAGTELLAASCLTTTFILSQREAAVRSLKKSERLQERFLPRSAENSAVFTVGLSQLTTSRQFAGRALVAQPIGNDAYRLDGVIPWVTAADRAEAIVGGATLGDGNQILFVLTPELPGLTIEPPMNLSALMGSRTAQVRCDGVVIAPDDLIAGPAPQVLGTVGGGGLDTSCLALGHGRAALELIKSEAQIRPDVEAIAAAFEAELIALRQRLHAEALASAAVPERTLSLRADATLFALNVTQMALLLSKGTGFVSPHPAQRLARQALFFLVWSCPRPVAEGVRTSLLKRGDCDI